MTKLGNSYPSKPKNKMGNKCSESKNKTKISHKRSPVVTLMYCQIRQIRVSHDLCHGVNGSVILGCGFTQTCSALRPHSKSTVNLPIVLCPSTVLSGSHDDKMLFVFCPLSSAKKSAAFPPTENVLCLCRFVALWLLFVCLLLVLLLLLFVYWFGLV